MASRKLGNKARFCPLRHAFGMTPPPRGEARLGSPFGGAVAARRLRGQLASVPHNSVSPRRRLYQRAAHALGGVTGKLGGNLRGIEDAIKKPPARVSYGKQSTGLFSYFPALAGAIRPWDAVPHPASFLSRKLGKELHPPTARTCAILSMSTSGSELPQARIESPGTGPPGPKIGKVTS